MISKKDIPALLIFILATAYIVYIVRGGTDHSAKISWVTMEEAQNLTAKAPRPVLVDVYTDWCGFCKKMDRETFSDQGMVEYINNNYYAVKVNAESKDKFIYKGITTTYEALAFDVLKVKVYPTLVLLDSDFSKAVSSEGYHSVAKLEGLLKEFGEKIELGMAK